MFKNTVFVHSNDTEAEEKAVTLAPSEIYPFGYIPAMKTRVSYRDIHCMESLKRHANC